ncbi:MAG: PilZ domain-containing protein [Sphingomonas sp.]
MSASQSAPFGSERGLETRQFARQPMLLAARLILVSGERSVSIRDLSLGGARIAGEDLPAIGTDIMLKRGDFESFGTIAWLSNGQAGIAFDELLDDEAVEAIQLPPQPTRKPQPGFGRKPSGHARFSDGQGWIDG